MMDVNQLRTEIVRPSLQWIGLWSQAAENLVMGTGMQESRYTYVHQLGGPALGLWQMEPRTHDDLWDNYLAFKPELASKVRSLASQHKFEMFPSFEMVGNLMYAAAMCRIHYRRIKEPLPEHDDIWGMAAYYKRYYNTPLGAATEQQFVDAYRHVAV